MNDYYEADKQGLPEAGKLAEAEAMADQLDAIQAGFGRLPGKDILISGAQGWCEEQDQESGDAGGLYRLDSVHEHDVGKHVFSTLEDGSVVRFVAKRTSAASFQVILNGEDSAVDVTRADGSAPGSGDVVAGYLVEIMKLGDGWLVLSGVADA